MTEPRGSFDPSTYPHGVHCTTCSIALTEENVMRVDITDPPGTPPWKKAPTDEPRVKLLKCVECVVNNRGDEE